jgi:hypothetical protein
MARDFLINSPDACCTINYFDNAQRYYYFIKNGSLFYQPEGEQAQPVPNPFMNCFVEKVAADSNRLFILTKNTETGEKKLYWCCIKKDIAAWVQFIFKVADILTSPDESIENDDKDLNEIDTLIKYILGKISLFKILLLNELKFLLTFMEMNLDTESIEADIAAKFHAIETAPDITQKKHGLKDLLNYLFTFLLKNTLGGSLFFQKTSFESFDQWVTAYTNWVKNSHQPFTWNELERDKIKVANAHLMRKKGKKDEKSIDFTLDYNDIIDIAIGNWHQTVTTFYLLLAVDKNTFNDIFRDPDNKELAGVKKPAVILYLDEEPIMHYWKIVPGFMNHPYPFYKESTIHAAHSVISGTKKKGDINQVFWIRHDYHNFEDFAWFPLNWTEFFFNKDFDVDTLRLYINNLDPEHNRSFLRDILIPKAFNYFFEDHDKEKPAFPAALLEIFKENDHHHPGWHTIDNPVKDAHSMYMKTCMEKPWPVPYINIFMLMILNFVEEYETLPIGDEKIQNYSKITDMILELLMKLHTSAKKKTKEVNRTAEIAQNLGFLGENPVIPSYNYPVEFIIKESPGSYKLSALPSADDTSLIEWDTIDMTAKYRLKASNNKFLCFRCDKDNRLFAHKSKPDNTSEFAILRLNYDTIVLQTGSGEYAGINEEMKKCITAENRAPGRWESFIVQPVEIAVKAANGKYVYINTYPGKMIEVTADRDEINKHTLFTLIKTGDSTYKILNQHTNLYLAAQNNEGMKILTNKEAVIQLSHFTLKRMGGGRWGIKTKKGYYMSLDPENNTLVTGPGKPGKNEIFTIVLNRVALRTRNGLFITKAWMRRHCIAAPFDDRRSLFEIRDINGNYFI